MQDLLANTTAFSSDVASFTTTLFALPVPPCPSFDTEVCHLTFTTEPRYTYFQILNQLVVWRNCEKTVVAIDSGWFNDKYVPRHIWDQSYKDRKIDLAEYRSIHVYFCCQCWKSHEDCKYLAPVHLCLADGIYHTDQTRHTIHFTKMYWGTNYEYILIHFPSEKVRNDYLLNVPWECLTSPDVPTYKFLERADTFFKSLIKN